MCLMFLMFMMSTIVETQERYGTFLQTCGKSPIERNNSGHEIAPHLFSTLLFGSELPLKMISSDASNPECRAAYDLLCSTNDKAWPFIPCSQSILPAPAVLQIYIVFPFAYISGISNIDLTHGDALKT